MLHVWTQDRREAGSKSNQTQQQTHQFLNQMRQMSPAAKRAFRDIYEQAPHGGISSPPKGQHVRKAMMAALTYPEIAYWTRLNLAVRVARKLAQTTGQHQALPRLEQTLEAFHQSAAAFVLEQKITDPGAVPGAASHGFSLQPTPHPARAAFIPRQTDFPHSELHLIQRFKSQMIPGLVHRIRATGLPQT